MDFARICNSWKPCGSCDSYLMTVQTCVQKFYVRGIIQGPEDCPKTQYKYKAPVQEFHSHNFLKLLKLLSLRKPSHPGPAVLCLQTASSDAPSSLCCAHPAARLTFRTATVTRQTDLPWHSRPARSTGKPAAETAACLAQCLLPRRCPFSQSIPCFPVQPPRGSCHL